MAIVISVDGGVDVFPNLRPPIDRKDIELRLSSLEVISRSATISRPRYRKIVNWLDEHRFYLLHEHCEALNKLIDSIEERLNREDPSAIHIVRAPVTPHSEMNPDLYYMD